MKNSILTIDKEIIEIIQCVDGLETCRASRLGSFLDGAKAYANLKILILLPEGQEITDKIGEDLQNRLKQYGIEKRMSIQALLEQLSSRYAILVLRVQDDSSIEFTCISYKQHQKNIKKAANRKKALEEERKAKLKTQKKEKTFWTIVKRWFC